MVVISTTDLKDKASAAQVWEYLKEMRLPTAPKLTMEDRPAGRGRLIGRCPVAGAA